MRRLAVVLAVALTPFAAGAQGYAGLGAEVEEGYAEVVPGRDFVFLADHGAHPDFRIEWWYVTANLRGPDGTPYGLQWTLFRSALSPAEPEDDDGWTSPQFWMAHAAVTTPDAHRAAERFARGGVGQAGVSTGPFAARLDDWRFASTGAAFSPLALSARSEGFAYDLELDAYAPPVLEGEGGYSVKSEKGQASYYYSMPFLDASGTIVVDGREIEVTGKAWLDREWSSQPLADGQEGWDWFALRLSRDTALMLYRLRDAEGAYVTGNWLSADGTSEALKPGRIEMAPLAETEVAGRSVPTAWSIAIPSKGLAIETEAVNPRAWMDVSFDYWEGPIRFDGSHEGVGYLEMTGY
ncbi:MAG: lipocalin-like domain-containing protein [Paracoccaceae bacterium]